MRRSLPYVAAVACLVGGGASLAGDGWVGNHDPRYQWNQPQLADDPAAPRSYGASGQEVQAMAMGAAQGMVRQMLPGLGENAPEWAKRIEIEAKVDRHNKPEYSILTVQPLYQDDAKQNTVFVQASQLRYAMFGEYRDTTNLGLGYRRLFLDDKLLAGVNGFYDREWTNLHQRTSVGAEMKFASLDLGANRYMALSDGRTVDTGVVEQALDGWDVELRSQLPFLPWARAGARYYVWEKDKAADDTKGWQYTLETDITQNTLVELGWSKDNANGVTTMLSVRFRLADPNRPTLFSDQAVSATAFEMRDMKQHTLEKVRRENKIIVERQGAGGVIIARGN